MIARLLGVAILLTGCPKQGAGEIEVGPSVHVLVRPDAPLYPSRDAAPAEPWRDAARAAEQAERGFDWTLWRLIRHSPSWALVESVPHADPAVFCRRPMAVLDGLAVQVWVPTAHLGEVTTTEVQRFGRDGGWAISEGLPVVADGDGFVVRLDGADLRLDEPPRRTGRMFEPGVLIAPTDAQRVRPSDGASLAVGGDTLQLDGAQAPVQIDGPDDDGLFTYTIRCGSFLTPDRLPEASTLSSGAPGRPLATADPVRARAEAPLYWLDGRPAGRVVTERDLGVEVPGPAGRRCFALDLVAWRPESEPARPSQALPLCVAPADIVDDDD